MSESMRELRVLAQSAMDRAVEAEHKVESHERVCAQRYQTINDTLGELRSIMKATVALLITALCAVAWAFMRKQLGL